MNQPFHDTPERSEAVAAEAAVWVMRHDRGLSPEEQDRYLQWLATDPRHAEAMATQRRTWEAFDRLAGLQTAVEAVPDPDLLAPPAKGARRRAWRLAAWSLAPLAAAAALAFVLWPRPDRPAVSPPPSPAVAAITGLAPIAERTLEDGSVVRLNRGAAIVVEYSAVERRVRLERGEAAFEVVKDATRPFVVVTATVAVRAVGTAFNVRLRERDVDVIVTEGSVALTGGEKSPDAAAPILAAGQRAVVPLEPAEGPPAVSTLPDEELARRLAWQPRILTFTDESLAVILNEFNRHNPVSLRSDDPALQELRLSARFRSDNVNGFLRLLESDFRVRGHIQPGGEIVLRSERRPEAEPAPRPAGKR